MRRSSDVAETLQKRIDDFYKLGKQFPVLTFFGIIMPVISLLGMPLGWALIVRRRQLLAEAGGSELSFDDRAVPADGLTTRDKLRAIRGWTIRFFVPSVVVPVAAVIGTMLYRNGTFDAALRQLSAAM